MEEIFINYRTGDGEKTAALIDRELVRRFGRDHVFRASQSIAPGQAYPETLLQGLRGSNLLLAVIGPGWITSQARLSDPQDWVRKEIEEAFACALPVVPVLDGRRMERLDKTRLPAELAPLADLQSIAFDTADPEPGLARILEAVADFVPGLKDLTQAEPEPPAPDAVSNSIRDTSGPSAQAGGGFTGDVGTVIKDIHGGNIHTGRGDIYQNSRHVSGDRHFSGDGMTYFEGDNHGGVRNQFGKPDPREDDQQ
ncbi:toll/interleukin-1 receptor domain-containing protein [Actinacidiphila yanglinensis]|uniref:toll/interleukin-1 receptor domain-containing protein n=1 Tax=Actinacidiphila yanglinensis TaxID=310779 RepID=UPI000CDE7580|nr:toll/interleukin-1 receptor domain-containing protein [Actinacidiphila yanglinensis]